MLEKKVIRGEGIKVPVHKLNSVLQIGDYIITSGVSPKDFVTNEWAVGMHDQALMCLKNIQTILETAGATLEDLISIEVYINDVRWYKEFNDVWNEFFAVAKDLETDGRPVKYLAQGTIYPDIIESGARKTGGKTATIKSHHNLIPFPEGVHFDLIEPLDHFFKDEVRALGLALGLPGHIVFRQPFPGPGLAIRIIGAVDKEKLEILKNADAIVREELDAYNQRLFEQTGERNSEHSCWQYFAVLPDIKSVGVMGDERTYQRPIILRAVESSDAMTADWAKLPYDVLARISGRIVAEVPGANRVCYDITSKPPATIEWE